MNRKRNTVLAVLRRLRVTASFETAIFHRWTPQGKESLAPEALTAAIMESTRLYRESWVVPLIDALIDYETGKITARELRELLP